MNNLNLETIVSILETSKKTGDRNYFYEYNICVEDVKCMLLESGFPKSKHDELTEYAIDLAAFSVFKHQIGKTGKEVSLSRCFKIFMGSHNTMSTGYGVITDMAWNQTIDEIVSIIKKSSR